jgi:two-component system cell cycle response regulator
MRLDVDHFKAINDEYGHLCGDLVLQKLAEVIRANLRHADFCGRLGGEEFAVILPETDEAGAVEFAERLRNAIATTSVTLPARGALHFTASIGATTFDAGDGSVAAIVDRADRAMYQAKRAGRNRVQLDKASAAHH